MTKADDYIWKVLAYMQRHYGCNAAEREIDPLQWYINTGRASADFLNRLYTKKPFMIARILHKGGSHDEAVVSIKNYVYK